MLAIDSLISFSVFLFARNGFAVTGVESARICFNVVDFLNHQFDRCKLPKLSEIFYNYVGAIEMVQPV